MFKVLGNVKKTELFGTYRSFLSFSPQIRCCHVITIFTRGHFSFRVETCVTLFERLVDVHNIDLVLSELEADEVCDYKRCRNPMRLRQVAVLLTLLSSGRVSVLQTGLVAHLQSHET